MVVELVVVVWGWGGGLRREEGRKRAGGGEAGGEPGWEELGGGLQGCSVFVLCRLGKLLWQSVAGPVSQDVPNERFISGCGIPAKYNRGAYLAASEPLPSGAARPRQRVHALT